jgi:plasmid stabilization system protein ParE
MQINRSKKFKDEFKGIVLFIAQDKKTSAKDFKNSINKVIDNLINFPYKYRKSIYFNDKNIRDMVFRGYTVIYEVKENSIEVMSIFNQNKP